MDVAERIAQKLNVCDWQPLLDCFRVSPRMCTPRKVLFIGESPHTDEVKSGCDPERRYPLAGQSGKRVTESLGDTVSGNQGDQPIGKLVAEGNVDWLGIINVVEVPLDPAAYQQLVAKEEARLNSKGASLCIEDWLKLMYSFNLIKSNPSAESRRECFVQDVVSWIADDFRCRLQNAVGRDTELVVTLGCVAHFFYDQCKPERSVKVMCAPHPSPRSKEGKWEIAEDLRSELRRIANSTNPSN